ncbi:hypothetical protein TNCV_3589351 [Trichonephila clavipes]|nr:hypothetical protein TNCV_3589351 [Trichonephila clavipes]
MRNKQLNVEEELKRQRHHRRPNSSGCALAFTRTFFQAVLFATNSFHLHTFMVLKSVLMESSHRSLGRPLALLPIGLCLNSLYVGLVTSKCHKHALQI